ncbi:MAG TPA: response regulator transcription factor [Burkholderiaceae bacterium]|nr:response regulator transcription factor [Burkholderiaceae bacterium]
MIQVGLVASSPPVRRDLQRALAMQGGAARLQCVATAPTLAALRDWLSRHADVRLDVIVVDAPAEEAETDAWWSIVEAGMRLVLLCDLAPEDVAPLLAAGAAWLPRTARDEEVVAAATAAAAGLVALRAEAIGELVQRAPATRARAVERIEPLTPRELEVLRLVVEGFGNKRIAAELGISEHTAKFHVGSILGKLDAATRAEAVAIALRDGLIID